MKLKEIKTYFDKEQYQIEEHFFIIPNKEISIKIGNFSLSMSVMHGKFKRYYKNGNLSADENYKNGFEQGLCTYWSSDGVLAVAQHFKNGLLFGEAWSEYKKF